MTTAATTPGTLRISLERFGYGRGAVSTDMEAYGFGVSEGVLTVNRSGDRDASADAMFYALSHVVSWYWLSKPEKVKPSTST